MLMAPKIHVVQQGEHLAGIAAAHGFSSFKPIFDHPDNAQLKALRKNPHVLLPGDKVVIPERELREEQRATDARHRFVLDRDELKLRVKLLDLDDPAVEGDCQLRAEGAEEPMEQKAKVYESPIGVAVKDATMLPPRRDDGIQRAPVRLDVGFLNPVTEVTGQRDRLNNLGYFAGFSTTVDDLQFRWAVEEFQADHRDTDGLRVTGVCDPERTQKVLTRTYGM
jgi:hypothetical protein